MVYLTTFVFVLPYLMPASSLVRDTVFRLRLGSFFYNTG